MKIKLINREALNEQLNVLQPTFWEVFKVTVGFTFFIETLTLILWLKIPTWNHLAVLRIGWVIATFGL